MSCIFNAFRFRRAGRRRAFTLVEVSAAVVILAGILATTLVLMNHCVNATIDLRSRERAFELARENLEFLLTASKVENGLEYGFDELHPEIQWQLVIEPFYEPISNRMWIRAVSSAEYTDTKGEQQTVELQHWLTGLTAKQIQMIQAQQKLEEEFLDSLYGKDETEQELIEAFLEEAGYETADFELLLSRQQQQKIAYLTQNGIDSGYQDLLNELRAEQYQHLEKLGIDWDQFKSYYEYYLGVSPDLGTYGGSDSSDLSSPQPL